MTVFSETEAISLISDVGLLVRENHPDKLIARGVPEEFIRLATDKLAAINTAYAKIGKERGWR